MRGTMQMPYSHLWQVVAGISGAAAVGLGAYGAHAFKPNDKYFVEVNSNCRTKLQLDQMAVSNQLVAETMRNLSGLDRLIQSDYPLNFIRQVFDRGNKYHLLHSLLLATAPLARRPNAVGVLATSGILLFSGSCYAAALTEDRGNAKLAPYGGMALIAAWLCLALP